MRVGLLPRASPRPMASPPRAPAQVLNVLLEHRADVNLARTDTGATPAFVAARQGHSRALLALLEARANVEAKKDDGQTPLTAAADRANGEAVRLLLSAKADVNALGYRGSESAMDCARAAKEAASTQEELAKANAVIKLLTEAGGTRGKKDAGKKASEQSALMLQAISIGDTEKIQSLLDGRADPNYKTDNG
ncbi:unnamed protein product, partial [Prorocentrum cordatum]